MSDTSEEERNINELFDALRIFTHQTPQLQQSTVYFSEPHGLDVDDINYNNIHHMDTDDMLTRIRSTLDTLYAIEDEDPDTTLDRLNDLTESIQLSLSAPPPLTALNDTPSNSKFSAWIALQPAPQKYFSNPVIINNTEFVAAPHTNGYDEAKEEEIEYLYSYNINDNKWRIFSKYPPNFHCKHASMCFNSNTNELYLYGSRPTMLKLNITTHKVTVIPSSKLIRAGMYAPTLFIKDQYHLIAGHRNSIHYVLKEGVKKIKKKGQRKRKCTGTGSE